MKLGPIKLSSKASRSKSMTKGDWKCRTGKWRTKVNQEGETQNWIFAPPKKKACIAPAFWSAKFQFCIFQPCVFSAPNDNPLRKPLGPLTTFIIGLCVNVNVKMSRYLAECMFSNSALFNDSPLLSLRQMTEKWTDERAANNKNESPYGEEHNEYIA